MRPEPPQSGGERRILLGWLAFHRETLALKCAGLAAEQLRAAALPPSHLSLLGLVRHMTEMERAYLAYGLGGGELEFVYCTDADPDADFRLPADADPGEALAAWRRERAHADHNIARMPSLDDAGSGNGRTLRWNLVKMIQEYARHNGHADLLRERIDGTVGE